MKRTHLTHTELLERPPQHGGHVALQMFVVSQLHLLFLFFQRGDFDGGKTIKQVMIVIKHYHFWGNFVALWCHSVNCTTNTKCIKYKHWFGELDTKRSTILRFFWLFWQSVWIMREQKYYCTNNKLIKLNHDYIRLLLFQMWWLGATFPNYAKACCNGGGGLLINCADLTILEWNLDSRPKSSVCRHLGDHAANTRLAEVIKRTKSREMVKAQLQICY